MTVFVTGGTGFVGAHILLELLQQGYRVRASARGPKVAELKAIYAKYGDQFEAVTVADLATSEYPLDGIDAVIHAASAMPGSDSPSNILDAAIDGTMNIVRQAQKAGVKRVIFTSSIFAVFNAKGTFTDQDWFPITKEKAYENTTDSRLAYRHSKALAEKELWAFADEHPEMDFTTFIPPFIFGPLAETFTPFLPKPNYQALSTDIYIYRMISPNGGWPIAPRCADVRDVAKVHVLAVKAPLSTEPGIGRKRFLIGHQEEYLDYPKFLQLVKDKRPELAGRLTTVAPPEVPASGPFGKDYPFDRTRLEKVLGFKKEDYATFEETFLDTVDSLIKLENEWKAKGYEVVVPPAPTDGL